MNCLPIPFLSFALFMAVGTPPSGRLPAAPPSARTAIVFDATVHDFGEIAESGGKVACRFVFENRGERPVAVTSVIASCGCTVPEFSRRPVLPGEQGRIDVTFDPMNRPGAFDKTVTVRTSENGDPVRLRIAGRVIARERGVEELYPCELGGGLRATSFGHDFGYVRHGALQQSAIGVVNASQRSVEVELRFGLRSGYLRADFPKRLAPGQQAMLNFGYELPRGCGVYGTLRDELRFAADGSVLPGRIEAEGVAVDDPLVYSDNCVPIAQMSENIIKFGPTKRSSGPSMRCVTLYNRGEAPLTVRAVESRVFRCSLQPGVRVAPGGGVAVEIGFDPAACDYGAAVERIRIVTDDPEHPMLTLRATAVVER